MSLERHERNHQSRIRKSRPLILYKVTREFVNDHDGVLDNVPTRDEVVELCRKHGLDEVDAIREDNAVPVDGRSRARCLVHFFYGKQLNGVARAELVNLLRRGIVEPCTNAC